MTPDVISVKAKPGYIIEAEFSDGQIRRFDMGPYLHYPAFAGLKNDGLFMRVHVVNGVVVWDDEIDLSPDTLYLRGVHVKRDCY
ncbi:MAG: DUF2442 domain-containing protein [Methylococcus sp.]|nr:DUF2442 domain-containing protein [Methylococcus sp.]